MDDKLEFYLDAKDILSQPTSCQAQGDYKKALEKEITEHRIAKMEISPLRGNYDLDHLSKIHEKIFEHIYDWAGEVRLDDISKRAIDPNGNYEIGHFQDKNLIPDELNKFSQAVKEKDHLKGLDKDQFVQEFTQLYAKLNEAHPFEEGNGRAAKLMMNQLANDAGYTMVYSKVAVSDWNYAFKRSLTDQELYVGENYENLEPMEQDLSYLLKVMDSIIEPYDLVLKLENTEEQEQEQENDQDKSNDDDSPSYG